MRKNFIYCLTTICLACAAFASHAAEPQAAKQEQKPVATARPQQAKPEVKSEGSDETKYPRDYIKCIKEAEVDEAKYDKIFNTCMEKNGFPQEVIILDGKMVDGIDDAD